tara:strand:+ start:19157 stop:19759 length:603 start_codon:yes stop_codon:yes gene_type:complete
LKTTLLIFLFLLLKNTASFASTDIKSNAPTPDLNKFNSSDKLYAIGIGSAFSLQKTFKEGDNNFESSTTGISLQISQIRPLSPLISTQIGLSYSRSAGDLKAKNTDFDQELYLISLGMQFRFFQLQHSPYVRPKIGYGYSKLNNSEQNFSEASGFYGVAIGYELPQIWGLKIRLEKSYQFGLYQQLNGSRFEQTGISLVF